MFDNYERKLHKCIANFIKRANKDYPDWSESRYNGEWEIDLNEFDDMCDVIFDIIKTTSCDEASKQMLDDILFGIARDNECSRIVAMLLDYPEWYELLCKKVLSTDYINAKWQFAESLKDCNGKDEIRELIFDFLQVDNEYTQRLALQSLAYIYPDKAEEYAIDFCGEINIRMMLMHQSTKRLWYFMCCILFIRLNLKNIWIWRIKVNIAI